jgi:hypothetical protein
VVFCFHSLAHRIVANTCEGSPINAIAIIGVRSWTNWVCAVVSEGDDKNYEVNFSMVVLGCLETFFKLIQNPLDPKLFLK